MSKYTEERFVDKSTWGDGPWQQEPDRVQWKDQATGFACLIVRGPSGALCGYVGVPPGHPAHGQDYDEIEASAHGGLTFAGSCQESGHICHVPEPGEPDDVWWIGFDCAHSGDRTPAFGKCAEWQGVYMDQSYVKREVTELAAQLAGAQP